MGDPGLIASVGLQVPDLVSGAAGGMVSAFLMSKTKPSEILGMIVVGTLTSGYLAEPFSTFVHLTRGPTGFGVGIAGMVICRKIIDLAQNWRPSLPPRADGGIGGGT